MLSTQFTEQRSLRSDPAVTFVSVATASTTYLSRLAERESAKLASGHVRARSHGAVICEV
jgi:hypothetical protein